MAGWQGQVDGGEKRKAVLVHCGRAKGTVSGRTHCGGYMCSINVLGKTYGIATNFHNEHLEIPWTPTYVCIGGDPGMSIVGCQATQHGSQNLRWG